MSTAAEYRAEFGFRIRGLAAEERREWRDTKENARARLARKLRVTPRQIERWEREELKAPRVDLWFQVEAMWGALQAKYEAVCESLEAKARDHNTDAAEAAIEGTNADRQGGTCSGAGVGGAKAPGLVNQDGR